MEEVEYRRLVLFEQASVSDAMADITALVGHLCEVTEDDYGKYLILRMIRDSLLHVSQRLTSPPPPPNARNKLNSFVSAERRLS